MKKGNEAIKESVIRNIRNLFEKEKEDNYKTVRVVNFWSRNYIEYESNGYRNKTPSTGVLHSKSDDIEMMSHDKEAEVIEELFELTLSRYQIGLEKSIKGGELVFDCVHSLYYECHSRVDHMHILLIG